MKISFDIPAQRIADLMVTAIEGNHMTRAWCNGIFLKGAWGKKYDAGETALPAPWYSNPAIYEGDFVIEIEEIIDESKPLTASNLKKHRCKAADFTKGFSLMAEHSNGHFADFMNENEDIFTADVFLQYVALSEVVYG